MNLDDDSVKCEGLRDCQKDPVHRIAWLGDPPSLVPVCHRCDSKLCGMAVEANKLEVEMGVCSVEGCGRALQARGYCGRHYSRAYAMKEFEPKKIKTSTRRPHKHASPEIIEPLPGRPKSNPLGEFAALGPPPPLPAPAIESKQPALLDNRPGMLRRRLCEALGLGPEVSDDKLIEMAERAHEFRGEVVGALGLWAEPGATNQQLVEAVSTVVLTLDGASDELRRLKDVKAELMLERLLGRQRLYVIGRFEEVIKAKASNAQALIRNGIEMKARGERMSDEAQDWAGLYLAAIAESVEKVKEAEEAEKKAGGP